MKNMGPSNQSSNNIVFSSFSHMKFCCFRERVFNNFVLQTAVKRYFDAKSLSLIILNPGPIFLDNVYVMYRKIAAVFFHYMVSPKLNLKLSCCH